jgi:hypothetical protein
MGGDGVEFEIGRAYSNEEIYTILGVGNAGGIRIRADADGSVRRAVLFTSIPTAKIAAENPYHDRLEGDVLVYTAEGRAGDQVLGGRNHRLAQQADSGFPIYCFQQFGGRRDRVVGPRRWRFLGLARYLRCWKERQTDADGTLRDVWVFELRLLLDGARIAKEFDREISASLIARDQADNAEGDLDSPQWISRDSGVGGQLDPERAEALRRQMLCLSPEGFERLVQRALSSAGFQNVEVTKRSQDGGIDLNARVGALMWPIRDLPVQVQAKRWIHTVGRREVAELRGSLQAEARGALVTTSQFSPAASKEASEPGKRRISLIDGFEFASIVFQSGLPIL